MGVCVSVYFSVCVCYYNYCALARECERESVCIESVQKARQTYNQLKCFCVCVCLCASVGSWVHTFSTHSIFKRVRAYKSCMHACVTHDAYSGYTCVRVDGCENVHRILKAYAGSVFGNFWTALRENVPLCPTSV